MALDAYPALTWPLLHAQLAAAQQAFLGGDCMARPHTQPSSAQLPPLLGPRFAVAAAAGGAGAVGGSTDAAVRLMHLLRAMAAANNSVVESKARDWVPLFLAFAAASPSPNMEEREASNGGGGGEEEEEEEEEGDGGSAAAAPGSSSGEVTGRAWRGALRDWLGMLGGLRGARGMYRWEAVQRAVAVQLMDVDPAVQQGALKCLKVRPWPPFRQPSPGTLQAAAAQPSCQRLLVLRQAQSASAVLFIYSPYPPAPSPPGVQAEVPAPLPRPPVASGRQQDAAGGAHRLPAGGQVGCRAPRGAGGVGVGVGSVCGGGEGASLRLVACWWWV
jgi:hypothetical protein